MTSLNTGTGSAGSACGSIGSASGGGDASAVARVNGVALHQPGEQPGETGLRELAWSELLRQEAVRQGLLGAGDLVDAGAQRTLLTMLERFPPRRGAGTHAGLAAFEEVRGRIAVQLSQQARAGALHRTMQTLAGRAVVEGISLETEAPPLAQ